jgi:hypothetical protein
LFQPEALRQAVAVKVGGALNKRGCPFDGINVKDFHVVAGQIGWASRGTATERALMEFVGTENLEERVDLKARTIDAPALAFVRKTFGVG